MARFEAHGRLNSSYDDMAAALEALGNVKSHLVPN